MATRLLAAASRLCFLLVQGCWSECVTYSEAGREQFAAFDFGIWFLNPACSRSSCVILLWMILGPW